MSVCVFRFVYTLPLRRNSEVKKISSDSESNSFASLSRISNEDIMEEDQEDVEESLTHKLMSRADATWRFDHMIQMPFLENSSTLRTRKIDNFYHRKLKFWNCVFQTLYFHIMWNKFSLHRHFKDRLFLCNYNNLFEKCPKNTFVFIFNLLQCLTFLKQNLTCSSSICKMYGSRKYIIYPSY